MKTKIGLSFVLLIVLLNAGYSAKNIEQSESLACFASIAISPDGRYVAAGRNIFNIIYLYDAKTLEIVKYFRGRQKDTWGKMYACTLSFSPDGKYLAAGGIDNVVVVWHVETGEEILYLRDLKKPKCVAFSPGGNTLAVAGPDDAIRLVNMQTGAVAAILAGHAGGALCAEFSLSKNFLVTGGRDNVLRLWDLESKNQLAQYKGHTAPVERIAFSPKGDKMVSASKSEIIYWGVHTQTATSEIYGQNDIQANKDALAFFVNLLGAVNLAHSGLAFRPVSSRQLELMEPLSADFSSDGQYLVVTVPGTKLFSNYEMRIKNLKTDHVVKVDGQFFSLSVSPDGKYVATAGVGIKWWDLRTGKEISRLNQ